MLPSGARPVTSWANIDEAFLDVVNGLQQLIESATAPRPAPEPPADTRDVPSGLDRLRVAYLAVLETPAQFPSLEIREQSQFASSLDRKDLERLRAKFPDAAPPPLWTAWMLAVHGDRLGIAPAVPQ